MPSSSCSTYSSERKRKESSRFNIAFINYEYNLIVIVIDEDFLDANQMASVSLSNIDISHIVDL